MSDDNTHKGLPVLQKAHLADKPHIQRDLEIIASHEMIKEILSEDSLIDFYYGKYSTNHAREIAVMARDTLAEAEEKEESGESSLSVLRKFRRLPQLNN
jgi:hypothetical protein